jgi:hypothetical protein
MKARSVSRSTTDLVARVVSAGSPGWELGSGTSR